MRVDHLEVPLTTTISNGTTVREVLAHVPDGKAYLSDRNKRLPLYPQKGPTCWYYALNFVRKRYGKNYRRNPGRIFERQVSAYQKALSQSSLMTEQAKLVVTDALIHLRKNQLMLEDIPPLIDFFFRRKKKQYMNRRVQSLNNCLVALKIKILTRNQPKNT